jgi:hypothetical protein
MNKKTLEKMPPKAKFLPKTIGFNRKPRQAAIYEKVVAVRITGSDPEKIQQVAHAIHKAAASTSHTLGGKDKKVVDITPITRDNDPERIFYGVVE